MKNNKIDDKYYFVSFFLRVGLVVVFLYIGIAAFLNPEAWLGFIPGFIQNIIPGNIFLYAHSVFNIGLAIWFLSNKKIFYASTLASLVLFAIIIFNFSALDIILRDIAILFSAFALMVLSYERR